MILKYKLNLQQFGEQQESINRLDEVDNDANNQINIAGDDKITFKHNNNTYSIPTSIFEGIELGNFFWDDEGDAQDVIVFARYLADRNGVPGTQEDFTTWVDSKDIKFEGDYVQNNYAALTTVVGTKFKDALNANQIVVIDPSGASTTGLTPPGLTPPGSGDSDSTEPGSVNVSEDQIGAFNAYYNDVYSLAPGTGGAEMLGRLEQSYANQAQQAATMADVGFQQAALQQASTVKQITDQVRGERMARLRAGMSESQIANQDMQMLMTNVNALNQNAQMLNDQRLQAQIGMNTSQDQAYMDFLNQSNARGQIATGMAASDAGDAYQQTIRQMTTLYGNDPTKWTAAQWTETSNRVSTGNPAGNVTR